MKKRALFVGINYPGTAHALNGCVNDVRLTSQMLTHKFGFKHAKDKRMLTDASATTQNILERLEWLVDGAQPGDVLFFHYSGHGSQVVDSRYDSDVEPDGLDEIICPIDLNWRDKIIKDEDFKRIFSRVPVGVNLTVLLDCCHSGGGIDSFEDVYQPFGNVVLVENSPTPNKNRLLPMPEDIASRGYGLSLQPRIRQLKAEDVEHTTFLISGCQSNQTSADAWIHNRYMGAATYFMGAALSKYNFECSYQTLIEHMNISLKKHRYTQRPELNGVKDYFRHKFLQPFV